MMGRQAVQAVQLDGAAPRVNRVPADPRDPLSRAGAGLCEG